MRKAPVARGLPRRADCRPNQAFSRKGCTFRSVGARSCEVLQLLTVDELRRDDGDAAARARVQRRSAHAAFERRALADDRPRPDLRDLVPVDDHELRRRFEAALATCLGKSLADLGELALDPGAS